MTQQSAARGRYGHVRFISAGAGSGKTFRLTEELERALVDERIEPGRVIGTTFTVKAAAELRERVRERLIRGGRSDLAEQTAEALIGTVHSVCERLLERFAFELGLSPELTVASIEDGVGFFDRALDEALTAREVRSMNALAARLEIENWRRDVKEVADRARDNDVAPDALAAMGRRSADDLLGFFPSAQRGDLDGKLLERVRTALAALDAGSDATAGTAKYQALLKRAIYSLRRPPAPWPLWMSLATGKATKASEPIAASVREAAANFAAHPRFQADIRCYVERVYTIAGGALARFRAIKTERGLIDFADMEQQLLHALDMPAIRARIAAELDLLLVDEFQDTNPMQLAIFMKLAELADRVIFVGDVKQAIYAFRGCDPDLVFELLAGLAAQGGDADVLEHSWRSRPALVDYINAVFGEAFAGTLDPAEVALEAKRRERTEEPAVLRWTLAGNAGVRAEALAAATRELVESGYEVVDRGSDAPRRVRWGDVAILAASNGHVEEIAKALRAARVPMKMTLSGLLTVPEICLARACLRRLSDAGDTLATAEIVAMSDGGEPETWLADRMQWLARRSESHAWGAASHPIVAKLEALRGGIGTQSPVEIVARVLNTIGIREIVTAWGPNAIRAAQRQRNLDALLNLAVEYERHCEAQHFAATLTGLLFWLEHPQSPELDLQPVVTTGDAVHVLTYHRAKGLEWPVVIAADLHYRWRARLWDVRAESDGAGFDLRRPLANRLIRFWPPLFGRRTAGLPVLDAIVASEGAQACIEQGRDESRRLAYVGLTRARDALVLAVPSAQPKEDMWLHALRCERVLPEGDRLLLPGGRSIATRAVALDGRGVAPSQAPYRPRRLPERTPLAGALRVRINPSEAPPLLSAEAAETVNLEARIALGGDDMTAIGTALHAAIAAELINPGRADALERTRALLEGCGVEHDVSADDALTAARRLRAWLDERFSPRRIWAEYPIAHARTDGHDVRGWIDVLAETEDGCVVVDHKSSPRPRSEWAGEACGHSGQLALYRAALEAAGKPVLSCWIHFPVGGGLVRVDWS